MEAFGKYDLLKRIGAGGMGEVFLARTRESPDLVVVKRILPHLTENARFLRLFLDEARIAARLVHPNVARILELGEADGSWFVAMEYVPGRDLRDLLRRMKERDELTPVEVALRIGVEVAAGLDYAHRATDNVGKPLKIVHRDVSPHNILISRYGDVKLIDFGVAKAANKSMHTATGILKGKFPYMAPEQANAKKVDPRTDVFALAIVMWELLTVRHLFRGKSDAATLKKVRACDVQAPSEAVPQIPKAVDKLLLRALEREPRRRYPNAGAFAEAIQEVLVGLGHADVQGFFHGLEEPNDFEDASSLSASDPKSATEEATQSVGAATVNEGRRPATSTSAPLATRVGSDPRAGLGDDVSKTAQLLSTIAQRPTNLAPQATSFIGRVAELADLHQLFRHGSRLITLLGPGGTGKTRLSVQFASQLVSYFGPGASPEIRRGGIWFCDLTEARDVEGICQAVARALAVPLSPTNPIVQLGHAIGARGETMLVLDNFEQVVAHASATVEQWMTMAPHSRIVVSSRELLRIPQEAVFEVPPMRTPGKGDVVRTSEAVQLFVERARAVRPNWEPSPSEEDAIAEIVRQLDGMPLAIELAAGRMGMLSPGQLVQRLPRRFDLLSGGSGATDRQATLRGAIDWSWKMLSAEEAAALAQLAIFRGGFTAEAAESVVDLARFPEASEVLSLVLTLRSKSLVRSYFPPGGSGEMRYGLFESIREYALEKLQALPEARAAKDRHTKYFTALGGRLSAGAEGSAALLDALELERENLNSVFQRALEDEDYNSQALSAVLALDPLLALRGPFRLHIAMLDAGIAKLGETESAKRTLGLEARGRARISRGEGDEAAKDIQAMIALARVEGRAEVEGRATSFLGSIERQRGNQADARRYFDAALVLHRQAGDRRMEGRTLSNIAALLDELGQEKEALSTYQLALEIHREVGDRRYEGITLLNLGVQQQNQSLFGQAKVNYQAALAIHRELGSRISEGIAHVNLGDLNRDLEQGPQALAHYKSALEIMREVGSRYLEGVTIASMASLYQEQANLEAAHARYTEALRVLREVGNRRYCGLVTAGLAATGACLMRLDVAAAQLAEATRILNEVGDQNLLDALDIYRAHVELSRAMVTPVDTEAAELEAQVEKRVQRAERSSPPNEFHPAGMPSPAERSEQVRAALRSLRAAMRRSRHTVRSKA
ncbi:MAG: Serine/threonine kinase family protein [Myxococcaceae bacterium]|nr:Serine/threonine kinase family protein [Myxococcaceae bacterium]